MQAGANGYLLTSEGSRVPAGSYSRERDVFLLTAKGDSNGEKAQSPLVSEAAIETHLRSALDKLELRARFQLVAFTHQRRPLGTRMCGGRPPSRQVTELLPSSATHQ